MNKKVWDVVWDFLIIALPLAFAGFLVSTNVNNMLSFLDGMMVGVCALVLLILRKVYEIEAKLNES